MNGVWRPWSLNLPIGPPLSLMELVAIFEGRRVKAIRDRNRTNLDPVTLRIFDEDVG